MVSSFALVWMVPFYFLWHLFPLFPLALDGALADRGRQLLNALGLPLWLMGCRRLFEEVHLIKETTLPMRLEFDRLI